jgi:hypothetical protein
MRGGRKDKRERSRPKMGGKKVKLGRLFSDEGKYSLGSIHMYDQGILPRAVF